MYSYLLAFLTFVHTAMYTYSLDDLFNVQNQILHENETEKLAQLTSEHLENSAQYIFMNMTFENNSHELLAEFSHIESALMAASGCVQSRVEETTSCISRVFNQSQKILKFGSYMDKVESVLDMDESIVCLPHIDTSTKTWEYQSTEYYTEDVLIGLYDTVAALHDDTPSSLFTIFTSYADGASRIYPSIQNPIINSNVSFRKFLSSEDSRTLPYMRAHIIGPPIAIVLDVGSFYMPEPFDRLKSLVLTFLDVIAPETPVLIILVGDHITLPLDLGYCYLYSCYYKVADFLTNLKHLEYNLGFLPTSESLADAITLASDLLTGSVVLVAYFGFGILDIPLPTFTTTFGVALITFQLSFDECLAVSNKQYYKIASNLREFTSRMHGSLFVAGNHRDYFRDEFLSHMSECPAFQQYIKQQPNSILHKSSDMSTTKRQTNFLTSDAPSSNDSAASAPLTFSTAVACYLEICCNNGSNKSVTDVDGTNFMCADPKVFGPHILNIETNDSSVKRYNDISLFTFALRRIWPRNLDIAVTLMNSGWRSQDPVLMLSIPVYALMRFRGVVLIGTIAVGFDPEKLIGVSTFSKYLLMLARKHEEIVWPSVLTTLNYHGIRLHEADPKSRVEDNIINSPEIITHKTPLTEIAMIYLQFVYKFGFYSMNSQNFTTANGQDNMGCIDASIITSLKIATNRSFDVTFFTSYIISTLSKLKSKRQIFQIFPFSYSIGLKLVQVSNIRYMIHNGLVNPTASFGSYVLPHIMSDYFYLASLCNDLLRNVKLWVHFYQTPTFHYTCSNLEYELSTCIQCDLLANLTHFDDVDISTLEHSWCSPDNVSTGCSAKCFLFRDQKEEMYAAMDTSFRLLATTLSNLTNRTDLYDPADTEDSSENFIIPPKYISILDDDIRGILVSSYALDHSILSQLSKRSEVFFMVNYSSIVSGASNRSFVNTSAAQEERGTSHDNAYPSSPDETEGFMPPAEMRFMYYVHKRDIFLNSDLTGPIVVATAYFLERADVVVGRTQALVNNITGDLTTPHTSYALLVDAVGNVLLSTRDQAVPFGQSILNIENYKLIAAILVDNLIVKPVYTDDYWILRFAFSVSRFVTAINPTLPLYVTGSMSCMAGDADTLLILVSNLFAQEDYDDLLQISIRECFSAKSQTEHGKMQTIYSKFSLSKPLIVHDHRIPSFIALFNDSITLFSYVGLIDGRNTCSFVDYWRYYMHENAKKGQLFSYSREFLMSTMNIRVKDTLPTALLKWVAIILLLLLLFEIIVYITHRLRLHFFFENRFAHRSKKTTNLVAE